ncbi:hypothetical protein [Nannocystis pusilla]|uniref:Uncharacterized protein n=1 Tax=Nannocystis pusilla TaxID=889268 RepID=A0ABS7U3Y7_9BACT|nr:hypothetical protein [Nannocystis pusilla]MBZ5715272.1 hypothetical protein [Nannocystis pusilla]
MENQNSLPTVIGTLDGPIALNEEIAVEFAPIGIGHSLCVELVQFAVTNAEDPPVTTTYAINSIGLQPELLTQDPNGEFQHDWDWYKPERPSYLGITDGRCACTTLCVCVSAYAHARLIFPSPVTVAMGETVTITVWGRRLNWMSACGPCPPCLTCGRTELTAEELASATDQVYVVD